MRAGATERRGPDETHDGREPGEAPEILIVDDNAANRLALEVVLAPLGYAVVTASSGAQALRLVGAHDFVLILMDVHMPDLDGYATTALVRQCERGREVPIVFLTAVYGRREHMRRGYELGAVDYIAKPFDEDVLRAKVRALVSLYLRGQRLERRRSEEYERLRSLFLAMVSHDLRNPTGAITMAAALLRARTCSEPTHGPQAATIERVAKRMGGMLEDLLDVVRGDLAGPRPSILGRSDMGDVCRTVLGELRLAHPARALELAIEGDVAGQWDAGYLTRAVSNLVGNALEHGDGAVRVQVREDGAAVTLDVRNGGTPIPPETMAELFEPFRSGSGSRGWGLGLYVVREIVRAHGGDVHVHSGADETVFSVRLPKGATGMQPQAAT
jgi:signal transduction histidine kinase